MRIEKIDIYHVSMPMSSVFRTACGSDEVTEAVFVRLESGGQYGWGEAASGKEPTYSPECAASQFVVSHDIIAPLILGGDIDSGKELTGLLAHIRGNQFAKAGFDMAWWDLHAKQENKPLWDCIGGRKRTVEAGADIGVLESIDDLLDEVDLVVRAGYRRVKLKCRPGWDTVPVKAVRREFPHLTIHVDCNGGYSLADMDIFEAFDRLNLAMIEQPLAYDDLIDHSYLQSRIATPICLDESVTSPAKAAKALSIGACRWINIKPGRVGGITASVAIHDICRDAGFGCWIGGMLESSVGAMHCLALATLPNVLYPNDIFPSERFYARDFGTPPMSLFAPGEFAVPATPGAGAEPDPELLEKWTLEAVSLSIG